MKLLFVPPIVDLAYLRQQNTNIFPMRCFYLIHFYVFLMSIDVFCNLFQNNSEKNGSESPNVLNCVEKCTNFLMNCCLYWVQYNKETVESSIPMRNYLHSTKLGSNWNLTRINKFCQFNFTLQNSINRLRTWIEKEKVV